MDSLGIYGELRELIGSPTLNQISNVKLDSYISPSLEWLAAELEYLVREDDNLLTPVADQRTYPLPDDFLSSISVRYSGNLLSPTTLFTWQRDGTNYTTSASTIPTEYAYSGRELWLNPPISAALIAGTPTPTLTIRYLAAPAPVEAGGPLGLTLLDQRLALLQAASLWCIAHPTEENNARYQGYQNWLLRWLPSAKRRVQAPDESLSPGLRPDVQRRGSAR